MNNSVHILQRKTVCPQEVVMMKAASNYTSIHLANGKVICVAKTLQILTDEFASYGFFRINRSSTVNLHFIAKLNESQTNLVLKNEMQLDISRRRKECFVNVFKGFGVENELANLF